MSGEQEGIIQTETIDPIDQSTEPEIIITDRGKFKLTPFMAMAWKAGFYEPGWSLIDYIRFAIDNYGWENYPIWGIKGCLPKDTKIATDCGIKSIKEIFDLQGCYVLSDNRGKLEYNYATPFFVGVQKLFKIVTSEGIIEATAEHPFMTSKGWRTVAELVIGDALKYIDIPQLNEVSHRVSYEGVRAVQPRISNNIRGTEILLQIMRDYLEEQTSRLQTPYRRSKGEDQPEEQRLLYNTSLTAHARDPNLSDMPNRVFSSSESKNKVLLQIMRNQTPQLNLWQPEQKRCCPQKNLRDKEASLCQDDKGTNDTTTTLESPFLGVDTKPQKRAPPDNEGIFQNSPRVRSEEGNLSEKWPIKNATQLYDGTRIESHGCLENTGNFPYLEHSATLQGQLCIPRFSNYQQQSSNRMQWYILASGQKQRDAKNPTLQTEWLYSNNLRRTVDKTGNTSYYKEATVLSITPSISEPVYNLEVANANNFFLANGILTHNSKKSNRLMWHLYAVYGNWPDVHKHMIMTPLEFTDLLKESLQDDPESGFRIPMIGWDDIGAWFDSQLYFENRSLYTKIKRSWTLMRTKLNVFASTIPRKDELPGFILRDINAEMFCSPKCTYTYDRWTWRKNYYDSMKIVKRPVNVDLFKPFDYLEVPTSEFGIYYKRRMKLANYHTSDLIGVLEDAFDDSPNEEEIDVGKKARSEAASIMGKKSWMPGSKRFKPSA